jgi:hypothetical protein
LKDIASVVIITDSRKNLITGDLNILVERSITNEYKSPKWRPEINVKAETTISIGNESNPITEAFLVLKPPVATILKAWFTASKAGIPARQSDVKAKMVIQIYTERIILISSLVLYL